MLASVGWLLMASMAASQTTMKASVVSASFVQENLACAGVGVSSSIRAGP